MSALLPLLLAVGCTTLSTLDGARTLAPGQDSITLGVGVQAGGNVLSTAAAVPLPQAEIAWRHGLVEDLDFGVRLYLVGCGADLRYRFLHQDRWHGAFSPGLGGAWVPTPGVRTGALDLRLPVIFERELGTRWSLASGPVVVERMAFTRAESAFGVGRSTRLDVYAGGTLRVHRDGRWLGMGIGADLLPSVARPGPPTWTAGVDLRARSQLRP